MRPKPGIAVALIINGLLCLLVGKLNHWLAPASLHIFAPGLLLIFPAFFLRPMGAVLVAAMTGACFDSLTDTPFGWFAFAFSTATLVTIAARVRLTTGNTLQQLATALFISLVIYSSTALLAAGPRLSIPAFYFSLVCNAALSLATVGIATPWVIQLHRSLLLFFSIDIFEESLEK